MYGVFPNTSLLQDIQTSFQSFPVEQPLISGYQALRQSKRAAQDQNSQVARFELDGLHTHQNVARGAETDTLLMVYCIATATGQCAWRSSVLLY